jgi:hypothetical protein
MIFIPNGIDASLSKRPIFSTMKSIMNKHSAFAITQANSPFWCMSVERQMERLQTSAQGLSHQEAQERLLRYGANRLNGKKIYWAVLWRSILRRPKWRSGYFTAGSNHRR